MTTIVEYDGVYLIYSWFQITMQIEIQIATSIFPKIIENMSILFVLAFSALTVEWSCSEPGHDISHVTLV